MARVTKTYFNAIYYFAYEVRVKGKPINPNKVKKSRGKPLKPELLAKFKQTVDERLLLVENLLEEKTSLVMLTRDD